MKYAVNSIHKTIANTVLNSIISQPSLSKTPNVPTQPSFNPISYPDKATNQSDYVFLISVIHFKLAAILVLFRPSRRGLRIGLSDTARRCGFD